MSNSGLDENRLSHPTPKATCSDFCQLLIQQQYTTHTVQVTAYLSVEAVTSDK